MKRIYLSLSLLGFICSFVLPHQLAQAAPKKELIEIDAVVASVDGEPITLNDIASNLPISRSLTLKEAAADPEAQNSLDDLISKKLIELEAKDRRVSVSDSEISAYLDEVASRNKLSVEGLELALRKEGKTLDQYKHEIRIDILRTKMASRFIKSGVGVTETEIDEYLEEHPELGSSDEKKVKLRQILIDIAEADDLTSGASSRERAEKIKSEIESGAISFEDAARKYSKSPDATEGGQLGVINENELNHAIKSAISSLQEGELTQPVETAAGYHLFLVEERFENSRDDMEALRKQIKTTLERRKLEEKMESFFAVELYENHSIDKKI